MPENSLCLPRAPSPSVAACIARLRENICHRWPRGVLLIGSTLLPIAFGCGYSISSAPISIPIVVSPQGYCSFVDNAPPAPFVAYFQLLYQNGASLVLSNARKLTTQEMAEAFRRRERSSRSIHPEENQSQEGRPELTRNPVERCPQVKVQR